MIGGVLTKMANMATARCWEMGVTEEISHPSGWQCNMACLGVQAVPDWNPGCLRTPRRGDSWRAEA